jgi:excisionase family DNA binding protein
LLWEGIGTREAAKLLGCSMRHVQAMCDEGRLAELQDWRKTCTLGGRGNYRIRREAIERIRLEDKG